MHTLFRIKEVRIDIQKGKIDVRISDSMIELIFNAKNATLPRNFMQLVFGHLSFIFMTSTGFAFKMDQS